MFSPKNVKHSQAAKSVVDVPTKVAPFSFLQDDKAPLVVPHVNREVSKEMGRVLHENGKKPIGSASQRETHVTEVAPQGFKGAAGVRVPGTVPVGGARGTPALPSTQRPSRQGGPVNTERVTQLKPARQVRAPVKQFPKELAARRQRQYVHARKVKAQKQAKEQAIVAKASRAGKPTQKHYQFLAQNNNTAVRTSSIGTGWTIFSTPFSPPLCRHSTPFSVSFSPKLPSKSIQIAFIGNSTPN